MAQIFISYRREEAAGYAGRIYDHLQEDFGEDSVFMDVDAIDPGVDFVERIESAVASADVFLAIVGRGWVAAKDAHGRRRLDDPNDFVRREVAAALRRRGIAVIPVLVGGAVMPAADELPEELAGITRRNALVLSDVDWRAGIAKLVAAVEKTVGTPRREPVPKPPARKEKPEPRERERDAALGGEAAAPAALLAGIVGIGLLVAATALRWEVLVDPDFGGGTVPNLGAVTAPASILVAVGALYALLKAWRSGAGPLATGLLLGFALGGLAKYGALLGQHETSERPEQFGSAASLLVGLAGSIVLTGLGTFWLVTRHRQKGYPSRVVGRVFAPAGAVLIAAATLVPFNVSFPETRQTQQVILQRDVWEAVDPLALAAAIVLMVFLAWMTKQLVVSGVFIALGLLGAAFWIRYIGVPALQMLYENNLASVRAGGFVGLAGSALVWRAGIVGRDRALEQEGEAEAPPEQRARRPEPRSGPTESW
jgi:hypothetical protein